MNQVDIIIPHLNGQKANLMAWRCLTSIRENSSGYRVIWIQNGGDIPPDVARELDKCEKILVIRNAENAGFVKATNQGLVAAEASHVVLMNNDAAAAPMWLRKLRKPLECRAIGATGPISTSPGSWQGRIRPKTNPYLLPVHLNLAFFCVMLRRDVIEKVGLLDEEFGLGLGDDDDYCIRIRASGYRLAMVTDLLIRHDHRTTFRGLYTREEIIAMQQAAVRRLRNKYPRSASAAGMTEGKEAIVAAGTGATIG